MSQKNVDQQEIAKFEGISSAWWDIEGVCKPLHCINPLRLHYIQQHVNGVFDKKILDVGVGGGILAESMAQEGADVTGLDMCPASLQVARVHALAMNIKINYIQTTIEDYVKEQANLFDIVTCMEMLEHVPNPRSIVLSCAKIVKPNGHVFFSTINRTKKSWIFIIFGGEYILNLLPKGTHDIKKFIRPAELIYWMDEAYLSTRNMTGIIYNPFTNNVKLSSTVDMNYMVHTIKL
ncbi:Ubiquinone biosynthesis O-methyltransferase [Candidatus Profftia lariciata]|uniref:bifunctional 2-polyprenyl-6-hydroxyphenol methylase/3-demethylubiquinol 3-O-methyltransferase UbiG n=1 Tax=Candidatus Profftia lariciata TaxID=1987921 RepID=UPI001D026FA0|nr:bifunctional 2-polyprenyl-6-hydroxyphenol methylase/3-demethylubiquinol 3-O-methyltransferase UbiG [Candidatus Profftia lariciata]UDG81301.1 Ubiquinone biosynthesis O-methyltransferase [Candidatus Profftia lariciata]